MRITFNMQAMKYDASITGALEALNKASDRVNKKQGLLAPEDGASNYVGAYNIQRMIDELTQFSKNAENAQGWLGNASKQLESALKALQNAKNDIAISGLDPAKDAEAKIAMADEIKKIYESIMGSANSSYLDRYIFGGYLTSKPPFSQTGNSVSSVVSTTRNGGNATSSPVFSDLKELASGKYKATITVENGVAKLTFQDSAGKAVMIDNNGSDQAGGKGNNSSGELLFEYKPGAVINTGRGVSFKMPDTDAQSVVLEFNYQSGSEMAYNGDSNSIFTKIGHNQDTAINMPGSSIFSQNYKTLLSTGLKTTNGRPVGLGTLLSQLDRTKTSLGDSIKVSGTDHSGKPIGSATVISAMNPKLDQTNTTDEERTLKLTYGNKVYQVVIPKASYKSTEELSDAINDQLKFAQFLGTIETPPGGFQSLDVYKNNIEKLMNSDYFTPADDADATKHQVNLSKNISISNDGDRLTFTTGDTGNNVLLAVSGGKTSSLGFKNITLAAQGKDNVFENAFDFSPNGIETISNTHSRVDFTSNRTNRDYQFVINGKRININVPAPTYGASSTTNAVDLSGTTPYTISIQGKTITVPGNQLASATTLAEKTELINKYINDAGFGGQYNVGLTGTAGAADITLYQQTSPTKKDIEFLLNEEIRKAGITDVTASLSTISGSGNNALGNFNVSFQSVNNNLGKSTQISSTYIDETTIPPTYDFQTDRQDRTGQSATKQKTVGDYINFLQSLYGEGVTVSLTDGKIEVKDNVGGSNSRLSMTQQPSNSGVGIANDYTTVLGGRYSGTSDATWNFSVTTDLQPNGSRTVSITVRDTANNVVFDQRIPNYVGGEIQLPSGVTITPNDMTIPATGTSKTTTFSTKLTANTNLSMGDMKVTNDGSNVNIFRELKNLENALRYNITSNGFGTPSSWKTNTLSNAAKPYFDGVYRGNYNDNWKYDILQNGSKTKYYLQNEYKSSTGTIKFDQNLINSNDNLLFNVDIFNNETGKTSSVPVNINLKNAFPPLTDAKSTQEYIIKELNNNSTMKSEGITFSSKDGKIEMSSNSGSKIASISEQISNTPTGSKQTEFTRYILGLDTVANSPVTFPLTLTTQYDFQVFDLFENTAGMNITKNISIPAGTYNTSGDLINALNAQLATAGANGTNGRITASMGSNGEIVFKNADGSIARSAYNGTATDNKLGINGSNTPSSMGPKGLQLPKLDLSSADDASRTLKFNYIDQNGNQATTSILLDKKAYGSTQEMADEINRLITAGGVINGQVTAKVSTDGMLTFQSSNTNVKGLSVEGDYSGTLGFPKPGDEVTIRVTSEDGTSIQEVKLNAANKTTYIADGLYLGFDKGTLNVADYFTGAVGSGIKKTISGLEQAEKQFLNASSQFGNRESRIESILVFNKTIIETNEKTKASYLGSTASDIAKAVTDLQLASSAYEAALSATNKLLSISLLNFLR